ncbi:cache domain-containing protein [Desulfobacter curvatus]|uniref:cache domain-containing protein n=1 Tax=Desulfobacter curvatus TaxID=2290 RepID=UPI00035DE160|nr:cache domain-containing protein [Desulfobacter curvatus]
MNIAGKKQSGPGKKDGQPSLGTFLRIIVPLFLTFILFAVCVFLIFVPSLKHHLIEQKKAMVSDLNDSNCTLTASLLSEYHQRVLSGELTLEDAQHRAMDRIRNLRYGPKGEAFFWIIDQHRRVIVQPVMPWLEGKDLSSLTSPQVKQLIEECVRIANTQGSGCVKYHEPSPSSMGKAFPGLSYVRLFSPWKWIIGTGIDVADITDHIDAISGRIFRISAGFLVTFLVLSLYITAQSILSERKREQMGKALRLDSLRLKKLRELNQMAEASLSDLTEFSLSEAIQLTQSQVGYLVFLTEDEKEATLYTWSNDTIQDCKIIDKNGLCHQEKTKLWTQTVRKRETIIINDYQPKSEGDKFPAGHIRIIRYMSVPVFDRGRIVAVAGVGNKAEDYNDSDIRQMNLLMDGMWKIIQRKASEEALRQSEERYRLLMENASDIIWTLQLPDMHFLYVSPSVETILGYTPEQIQQLGLKDINIIAPEYLDRFIGMISEEMAKEGDSEVDPRRSWSTQVEQVRKDGSFVWTEIKASFLRDEAGRANRVLGVTRDITQRRRIERRLQQSQKMEAIGTLAGGIAHDFNNILSSILGFTELARLQCNADPDVIKSLDKIYSAGIRARDLIRHILIFSRQQEIRREPLVIMPLVKECLTFIRASIPKNIEIIQKLDAHDITVVADASQIHQIIMNLCTNAAHAMEGKNGIIEVGLKSIRIENWEEIRIKGLDPGNYIELSITDSGCGIPKPVMDRIYEPFFTTKDKGQGTGMGLSIVHGIVKDMGGGISAYSEPGKGSVFKIYLPAGTGKGESTVFPGLPLTKESGRILMVDDEEDIVISGRLILMTMGYEVTGVTDSLEALEIFKKDPQAFDLVLSDLTMPRMTGIQLIREIRKLRRDIPIILSTGFSDVTSAAAKKGGAFAVIMKPLIARELAEAVRAALNPKTL